MLRALFVGGTVDNSELDLECEGRPSLHYPENGGAGRSRYRLYQLGLRGDNDLAYAVYAAPDMADSEVDRIIDERDYPRRFEATPKPVLH